MNIQNLAIKNPQKRNNNPLLPSSLRGLIVGRGNSGKTVLLLNLLLRDDWLDYNNLLVFGNSLQQDEYQIIKKGFELKLGKKQVSNLFKNQEHVNPLKALEVYRGESLGGITAEFYEDCDAIPDPKTLDAEKKNCLFLMIVTWESSRKPVLTIVVGDITIAIHYIFRKIILLFPDILFVKTVI